MEAAPGPENRVVSLGSRKTVMGMWLVWFTDQLWMSCAGAHRARAARQPPKECCGSQAAQTLRVGHVAAVLAGTCAMY